MTHNVTERSSPIPKIWMYRGSRAAAHRGGLHIVLQWAGLGIYDATHTKVNGYQWTDAARPKNFQKSTGGTSGAMTYDLPNPTAAKNGGGTLAQQAATFKMIIALSGMTGSAMPSGNGGLVCHDAE